MTPARLRNIPDPADRARAAEREIGKTQRLIVELAAIRHQAVLELRAAGASHADVARALGISRSRAAALAQGSG